MSANYLTSDTLLKKSELRNGPRLHARHNFSVTNFTELHKYYILPKYQQLKGFGNKAIRNVGLLGKTNRKLKIL